MSRFSARKPLAAAAILASSVGSVLAASGTAGATSYGIPGSPVTVTTGTTINVVGGGTVSLPAGAHDVSWSGQGGRFAFIGGDQGIYTADFDGSHIIKIAQGVSPAHTVWNLASTAVYWTEGTGTAAKIVGAFGNGSSNGQTPWDVVQNAPAGLGLSNADIAADDFDSIVVQTTDASGTGISVRSYNTSGTQVVTQVVAPGDAVTGGSQPTISPDGKTVVFVRTDATGDKQLFASQLASGAWSTPAQITWGTGQRTAPIFEAGQGDGSNPLVAYSLTNLAGATVTHADGTYTVDVKASLAAGKDAGLETKISDLVGGVAVRTDAHGHVTRFPGFDRFDTAAKASQQAWRTTGAPASDYRSQAGAVVLSRSDAFADALGGSALAAHKNAPLLLTETGSLNKTTQGEIQRILPAGGTVYVLGGEKAISSAVTAKLAALGYHVNRISGVDRYATSVNIANAIDPNAADVLVATGVDYPDALSAGAAAASFTGMTVVLTNGSTMPAATNAYLEAKANANQLDFVAAVGGPAAKAMTSAGWHGQLNLIGIDRYQTSFKVAGLFQVFGSVGVATGRNWPDSLSGGALVGRAFGPLLLVDPNTGLTAAENDMIDSNRGAIDSAYIFGGQAALPGKIDDQLAVDVRTAVGVTHSTGIGKTLQAVTPNVTKS